MSNIDFHYAVQICDSASFQGQPRICGDDRTLLSKKSLTSFLNSIKFFIEKNPETKHTIMLFNDRSSEELLKYVEYLQGKYTSENISIDMQNIIEPGISNSIRQCYLWLQANGKNMVYQIQDDYIFYQNTIQEMYEVFDQMKKEINYDIIVSPFNDYWLWLAVYRNSCTPRTVVVGKNRYWIQYYDMSCSFMTSHTQFGKHWDLYHRFFQLIDEKEKNLEKNSLNFLLTQRVLGLIPVNNLAFHMQSELEEDPHIDWRPLWDEIDVSYSTN